MARIVHYSIYLERLDATLDGGEHPQGFFMDGLEVRRRRALYRANHRGTKELDLMLGRFANERVPAMSDNELTDFEQLMALPEPDIDHWLRKGGAPEGVAPLVSDIRRFLNLET